MPRPPNHISFWTGRFRHREKEAHFARRSLSADASRAMYLSLAAALLNLLLLFFDDLRTHSSEQLLSLISIRLLTCLTGVGLALSFRAWPRRWWINWGQVLLILACTISFAASGRVYQNPHLPNTGFGGLILVSLLFLPAPCHLAAAALVWITSLVLNPMWHMYLSYPRVAWASWFLALGSATVMGGLAGYRINSLRRERHHLQERLAAGRRRQQEASQRSQQNQHRAHQAKADLATVLDTAPYPLVIVEGSENRILQANQRAADLLAAGSDGLAGRELAEMLDQPRDLLELLRRLQQGQGAVQDLEMNLRTRQGHPLSALVSAAAIPYQGRSVILCTINDISQGRSDRRRLDELEGFLKGLKELLPIPMVVSDPRGRDILSLNRAAGRLLALEAAGGERLEFYRFWCDPEQRRRLERHLPLAGPLGELELRLRDRRGREQTVLAEVIPGRFQGQDMLIWFLSPLARGMGGQAERERRTGGLVPPALLRELAEREFKRARRFGRPLALVLVELDRFADIKFKHGYSSGARLLEAAGEALTGILRGVDIIGQGGEGRLVLLLPETEVQAAGVAAERMRQALARVQVAGVGASIFFTASLGVAGLDSSDRDLDQLLARAQRALERARRHGGNQVRLAGPEEYQV